VIHYHVILSFYFWTWYNHDTAVVFFIKYYEYGNHLVLQNTSKYHGITI